MEDTLYGGKDDDLLIAGSGPQVLSGDLGDDKLVLGSGTDTVLFNPGGGYDVVVGFKAGIDRIDISAFVNSGHTETLVDSSQGLTLTTDSGESLLLVGLHAGSVSISGGWII